MQLYKHNTSRDGTHKQARGQSVDAALFAEELAEKLHFWSFFSSEMVLSRTVSKMVIAWKCSLEAARKQNHL